MSGTLTVTTLYCFKTPLFILGNIPKDISIVSTFSAINILITY